MGAAALRVISAWSVSFAQNDRRGWHQSRSCWSKAESYLACRKYSFPALPLVPKSHGNQFFEGVAEITSFSSAALTGDQLRRVYVGCAVAWVRVVELLLGGFQSIVKFLSEPCNIVLCE